MPQNRWAFFFSMCICGLICGCTIQADMASLCVGDVMNSPAYFSGDGTESNPYVICSKAQFLSLVQKEEDWTKHFVLANDLNFEDQTIQPIGNGTTPFSGSFDGANYKISNFFINAPTEVKQGLFGSISNATIKNLNLLNAHITGSDFVGSLVGYAEASKVLNVKSESTQVVGFNVEGTNYVGGLIGNAYNSNLEKASSFNRVKGLGYHTGGLVGMTQTSTFSKTRSDGYVQNLALNGCRNVGGHIGYLGSTSSVTESFSDAQVESASGAVGGLVGWAQSSTITNSFSTGAVSGGPTTVGCALWPAQSFVGGLVGVLAASNIQNSYSTSNTTTTGEYVSSLVGLPFSSPQIRNSFATGTATASSGSGGGICTDANGASSVGNYWDTNRSGLATPGQCSGTAVDTSIPGSETYFFLPANLPISNWDFTSIWKAEMNGYPKLQWAE